jgi:hypothetical protein
MVHDLENLLKAPANDIMDAILMGLELKWMLGESLPSFTYIDI